MSALRTHTCILKTFIRLQSHKTYSRTFCAKFDGENVVLKWTKRNSYPVITNIPCVCCYSKQTSSVTDEFLVKAAPFDAPTDPEETNKKKEEDKKEKESKWKGQKNAWKIGLISLGATALLIGGPFVYLRGAPLVDPGGKEIEDEFSQLPLAIAYLKRSWLELNKEKQAIIEPSREKLLPDPVEYPYYQPPYTVVMEMNDVLVHPDWTYNTGWRFKKRPHIEYFLQSIAAPLYEVVVYTQDSGANADPILFNLDQKGYINYRLYRDATRYTNGHHVKDLSCLNRDLSKVIFIDWNEKSFSLQPRNALKVNRWTGDDDDRSLIDLANFLQAIAATKVDDVREVLDYYKKFDDPLEAFKDNQRKLQEEQERQSKIMQEREKKKPTNFGLNFLGRR
ncbi:mitochondrial import inner membrane translocase subunit TIM50-C-like [Mytilus edulis]|uniref:mitochondrial import inner membrane translocase subunit TIM50-C-like n=1 Tax=Mytilus edulis TaxID=6550 RepID=UPI0039EF2A8C